MRLPSAYCFADPNLLEVPLPYTDVPLPPQAEIDSLLQDIPMLARRAAVAPVDATPIVDMSMRFACLAYRRNSESARSILLLREPSASPAPPYGVELQFRSSRGAHAVVYLVYSQLGRLSAVLSFKGSTLSSPGAPILSDWVVAALALASLTALALTLSMHSLPAPHSQLTLPAKKAAVVTCRFTICNSPSGLALVSSWRKGARRTYTQARAWWYEYLQDLLDAFRFCQLSSLPGGLAASWGLPPDLDLWSLLCSTHCHQLLVVGHSLGGALAASEA
ncbi:MAG: hypothetical protein SGPRY_013835, partial [Prymnesium sp.]